MSPSRIGIDRLAITLHGVSETVAEQAADNLERLLRVRLAAGPCSVRSDLPGDLASLCLPPVEDAAALDGSALAEIIADRLVEWLGGPNAATWE
jgi:hypothetical protein